MNKSENREVTRILAMSPMLGLDFMARALSALHRAARTRKSRDAIYGIAYAHGAYKSAEFII